MRVLDVALRVVLACSCAELVDMPIATHGVIVGAMVRGGRARAGRRVLAEGADGHSFVPLLYGHGL